MSVAARRVALVCDYSLDYLGGAQSAFLDEARLLRDRGHEVVVVAPASRRARGGALRRWQDEGGDVIAVRALVTLPGVQLPVIRNTQRLRDRLADEFAERAIDVVHVHSEFGLSAAAVSVARARSIRTVQTVHTFFWRADMPQGLGRPVGVAVGVFGRWLRGFPTTRVELAPAPVDSALRNLTLSLALRVDVVVSPSAHQGERLHAAGVRTVRVVPNAVAPGPAGEPLTEAGPPLRILWVGRLVPEKRLIEWIDAVVQTAAVVNRGSFEVEIVGEGPLRAVAEQRSGRAPVRFLGRLPREGVQERMRAAHLIALTSFGFDNQPVTIVEALEARRGIFYVDPALTEGTELSGIRASGPDVRAMSQLLVSLVRDPRPVIEASARAGEAAREFDPVLHVARITDAYAAQTTC
ncbi:glycosyltransferase family 4 protein [Microbacterium sp.]|uniref:glycosyltransferase family 4 protein n=1 Tax=Microbacterium sp. TaxID=51671 RepID=UPI0027236607|nr:glycosyltransferase family 4 protein [Microbacterium sp.]MDO8383517.1 glycosyltransferase family 4 protein [Microbacterium sp.]